MLATKLEVETKINQMKEREAKKAAAEAKAVEKEEKKAAAPKAEPKKVVETPPSV